MTNVFKVSTIIHFHLNEIFIQFIQLAMAIVVEVAIIEGLEFLSGKVFSRFPSFLKIYRMIIP